MNYDFSKHFGNIRSKDESMLHQQNVLDIQLNFYICMQNVTEWWTRTGETGFVENDSQFDCGIIS